MGRWWVQAQNARGESYSINRASKIADVIIEPRVGGRWYERGADGSECQWGKVIAWEPPARVVLAWQINGQWQYDPELVTEVEVRFVAEAGTTRVELEHRDLDRLGPQAAEIRAIFDSPGGWLGLLGHFVREVDA
jgi:uncharacterized protein YndB with AHSA1/START domain